MASWSPRPPERIIPRPVAVVLAVMAAAAVGATVALAHETKPRRVVGHGQVRFCIRGVCGGPELWAHRSAEHARGEIEQRARARRLARKVERLARELRAARASRARTLQAHETPQDIIRGIFGAHGDEAVRVSYCETGGTFSTNARNGQYLGLFQMGAHERATYGDASDARGQSEAAHRYFVATGSDWSPWECKP